MNDTNPHCAVIGDTAQAHSHEFFSAAIPVSDGYMVLGHDSRKCKLSFLLCPDLPRVLSVLMPEYVFTDAAVPPLPVFCSSILTFL